MHVAALGTMFRIASIMLYSAGIMFSTVGVWVLPSTALECLEVCSGRFGVRRAFTFFVGTAVRIGDLSDCGPRGRALRLLAALLVGLRLLLAALRPAITCLLIVWSTVTRLRCLP